MRSVRLVVLLFALPLSAQRHDDTITVNIVDVPVYVERFGEPVMGLTREDFELLVNGKPHPIESFDVMESGESAARIEADVPVDLRRRHLIVLLFDVWSSPASMRRAQKAAARYVDDGAPGDAFAVATVSSPGVLFIVPFTNDRVAVQRAIATLRPSAARDPFRLATLSVERGDIWRDGPTDGYEPPAIAGWHAGATLDMHADQNDFSDRGLIDNLTELAGRLAALDGAKEVVLFSPADGDPTAGFSWAGRLAAMVRLHQRYRAAGVILNAVDSGGPGAPGGVVHVANGARGEAMPGLLTSSFLWSLALDTGGIATSSMPELQKRSRAGYRIAFRAPVSDSKTSSIRIRVKNQPLITDVRYRKSYTLEREPADDGLFLADTLLNDIPQNGVTLDLEVNGTWLAASIPGVELLSYADSEPRLRLDVYFYVFDGERAVAWNRMQIAVDLEKGREFLSANPYTIRQEFKLEPGRYVAKALVRIVGTDRVGFERAELEVRH